MCERRIDTTTYDCLFNAGAQILEGGGAALSLLRLLPLLRLLDIKPFKERIYSALWNIVTMCFCYIDYGKTVSTKLDITQLMYQKIMIWFSGVGLHLGQGINKHDILQYSRYWSDLQDSKSVHGWGKRWVISYRTPLIRSKPYAIASWLHVINKKTAVEGYYTSNW